jgi:hypothetical protein
MMRRKNIAWDRTNTDPRITQVWNKPDFGVLLFDAYCTVTSNIFLAAEWSILFIKQHQDLTLTDR